MAAGALYSLALTGAGGVIAWGSAGQGEPAFVPPEAESGVVAISAGAGPGLAIKSDGSVLQWGPDYVTVAPPAETSSGVVSTSVDFTHRLALREDGRLITWGELNGGAGLPPGDGAPDRWRAVDAGTEHSTGIDADGDVHCWGTIDFVPPEAATDVTAVSAGSLHSVALKPDGRVVAWGTADPAVLDVPAEAGRDVRQVDAGWDFTLALR